MPEPMTPERLAEIRERANALVNGWPLYITAPTTGALDCRALLAEVDRLKAQAARFDAEWAIHWKNTVDRSDMYTPCKTESGARKLQASLHDIEGTVVRRLVGPWRPVPAPTEESAR